MGTKKGNQAGDLSLSSQKEEMGFKKREKNREEKRLGFFLFIYALMKTGLMKHVNNLT